MLQWNAAFSATSMRLQAVSGLPQGRAFVSSSGEMCVRRGARIQLFFLFSPLQDGPTWRPEAVSKSGKRQFPYMEVGAAC